MSDFEVSLLQCFESYRSHYSVDRLHSKVLAFLRGLGCPILRSLEAVIWYITCWLACCCYCGSVFFSWFVRCSNQDGLEVVGYKREAELWKVWPWA